MQHGLRYLHCLRLGFVHFAPLKKEFWVLGLHISLEEQARPNNPFVTHHFGCFRPLLPIKSVLSGKPVPAQGSSSHCSSCSTGYYLSSPKTCAVQTLSLPFVERLVDESTIPPRFHLEAFCLSLMNHTREICQVTRSLNEWSP